MPNNELIENIKLAFNLQKKGQYREAIAVLYKVLAIEPDNIEAIIQIAYLFYARHDIDLSTDYYEKALSLEPNNSMALEGLLTIYKAEQNYDKALETAKQLCSVSKGINSYIHLLYVLCLNGQYTEVIEEFKKFQYLNPNEQNQFINFYVGLSYFNLAQYDQAQYYLQLAVENDKDNAEAIYYLAKIEFDKNNFQKTDELLDSMLAVRESAKAYNLKGLIQLNFLNNNKAINFFTYATKINSKMPEYFYNLGIAYSLNGWFNEAEKCYLNAIILEPSNYFYHYTLAYLYYEMNEYQKAQEELGITKELNSEFSDADILQGLIFNKDGKLLEAKAILEKLNSTVEQNDFLQYALGLTYKKLDLKEQAIKSFENAMNLKSQSEQYAIELADALFDNENYEESLLTIESLIQEKPKYIEAYLLKAKINIAQSEFDKAMQILKKALELDTNSDRAFFLMADIFLKTGNTEQSTDMIKKAILLAPDNLDYYKFIAKIYESTNNYADALAYYVEIIEVSQENPELFLQAAKCAEKIGNTEVAKNFYLRSYVLAPKNPKNIEEYANFLVRQNKYKKAIKFLYDIIKNETLLPSQSLLIPKLDAIKQEYLSKKTFLGKIFYKLFKI